MNELIQITRSKINGAEVNSVNINNLVEVIGIMTHASQWFQRQVQKYGFVENEDYLILKSEKQTPSGIKHTIDYIVTIDTAKELAMLVNNEQGRNVRKYFIEVEKQSSLPALPQTYIEALEALTASEKEKLVLSNKIIEKDKVILAVADLNIRAGDVTVGDFSKNLAIEGLGQNNLFSWLKGRGFLMMNTAPYQQYVERGYFVRKPSNKKINGEVRYTTMLTPKGTIWLTKMLKAEYDLD